jgi:hypothetical protein
MAGYPRSVLVHLKTQLRGIDTWIRDLHVLAMPRKPKPPPPDNPEQFKRFVDTAREVEADESPDAIDRAFNTVVRRPLTVPKKKPA